jgi:ketosteroid isomerase-like protein
MHRLALGALLWLAVSTVGLPDAQAADEAIHEELRGLLRGIQDAVNQQRYGDLAPFFHGEMRVTTINQESITAPSEIAQYFERWFGKDGFLSKVDMRLTADALTQLYDDNRFGVVSGSGDEDYILADGRTFAMKTRWTATTIRDSDGRWKILTLHIGTNFLDNPILTAAEGSLVYAAVGGAVGGLLIGVVATLLVRRRRAA